MSKSILGIIKEDEFDDGIKVQIVKNQYTKAIKLKNLKTNTTKFVLEEEEIDKLIELLLKAKKEFKEFDESVEGK